MLESTDVPESPDWPRLVAEKAADNARRYESCTQSILAAFMEELGIDDPLVMRAAGAMHGGMLTSNTCGVVAAGMMVLGLAAGRERLEDGVDGLFSIVMPAQELVARLEERLGSTSCRELSGVDFKDLEQAMSFLTSGENEKCFGFIKNGAEEIASLLQEASQGGQLFRFAEPEKRKTAEEKVSP